MEEQLYFNIRSKECTQVSNNADLIVNLPFSIDIADDEWLQVEVISAEIPLSFYNISSALQNNVFTYTRSPNALVVSLIIPDGNHTVDSLMSTLNGLQSHFIISYSDVFNKFLITLLSPTVAISVTYSASDYCQQLFGIIASQQITSSSFFMGVCNLASVHSILVRSSLNSGNSASTSQSNNDIIQKISLDVNFGGIIIFNQNSVIRKNIIKNGSIRQFYLKLTDQNQKILDLNSCNFEMSILFTKINHNLNTVSEEQRQRRTNNYIEPPPPPPPVIQAPVMQPTYQPTSTFTPESSTTQNEGDKTQNILTPLESIPSNNEPNLSNQENSLTQINEALPVKPVEPPKDPYSNLDSLLLSLVDE